MPYVSLAGLDTYYEIEGAGEPLLLLHGGFCSLETLRSQIDALSTRFRVYSVERAGHGRTADRPGPMTFDSIVADTLAYLDAMQLERVHIVGFSDGAIAGLLLARDHPARVASLVAIGANLDPSGLVDEQEADRAESSRVDVMLRRDYDRLSPDGPEHATVILGKLARLWADEPRIEPESLAGIAAPTLIMTGDHDSIRIDHTVSIAAAIPDAQLCVIPGARHEVMMERPELVNAILGDFLTGAEDQKRTRNAGAR